jgi:hypothetical protein
VKTTVDIPDDIYRRVKAKSALQGRTIRELTSDLYRRWLEEDLDDEAACRSAMQSLEDFLRLGKEAGQNAPPGPTATEVLERDRGRLDRSRLDSP